MRVAVSLGGTDWGRSGLGTYVRQVVPRLAAALAKDGGSVVAFGTAKDLEAYSQELRGVETVAVLPKHLDAPLPSALWHLGRGGKRARTLGADVLLLLAANRRLVLRASLPTVGVVHDLAWWHVRGMYSPLHMLYARHFVGRALRSLTQLVAISNATRDDLIAHLKIKKDRVRVVLNGVDAERFRPDDDGRADRARRAAGLEGPYLLYVSRLEHPGKNHLRLIRAFHRSRARSTHHLVLVGADWGAGATIRAEASRLGLGDRVRMLDYVDASILPGLVAGADAVAMVGLREGFGLPALEALASGRAVISSNTGALPEVVGDLGAECDPLDEVSIANAIERALSDEVLRGRCRMEGPVWAARHGWDRTVAQLAGACEAARKTHHD